MNENEIMTTEVETEVAVEDNYESEPIRESGNGFGLGAIVGCAFATVAYIGATKAKQMWQSHKAKKAVPEVEVVDIQEPTEFIDVDEEESDVAK